MTDKDRKTASFPALPMDEEVDRKVRGLMKKSDERRPVPRVFETQKATAADRFQFKPGVMRCPRCRAAPTGSAGEVCWKCSPRRKALIAIGVFLGIVVGGLSLAALLVNWWVG